MTTRAAALALVVALAACNPAVAPTAIPGATRSPTSSPISMPPATPTASAGAMPTASGSASPSAVPTAVPTAGPTASPTVSPTISPTFEPTPSPTASPAAGWQLVAGFPAQGASSVDAIVAVEGGFVAIGTHFDDGATCFNDARHGRVWFSSDGHTWLPQPDDVFAQAEPWLMFEFAGGLMVIGFVGSADPALSCNPPDQPGLNAWRSTDGGRNWQHLGQTSGLDAARLTDITVSDAGLVAVGGHAPGEVNQAGAWLSSDGLSWQAASSPPQTENRLNTVAARGSRVVAFADCCDEPLAFISRDGGHNWFEASLTIPLVGPDDIAYPPSVADVAVVEAGFVAVGYACCLSPPPDQVPITLISQDGEDWLGAWVPVEHEEVMHRLAVLPASLLAVGNGTYEVGTRPPSDPNRFGGRSWTSSDGVEWRPGPRFMELASGYVTAIATGSQGVVVAGASVGPGGPRIWHAPLSAFD